MSKFWEYTKKGMKVGVLVSLAFGAIAVGSAAFTGGLAALTASYLANTAWMVAGWIGHSMIVGGVIGGSIGIITKDEKPAEAKTVAVSSNMNAKAPATKVVVHPPQQAQTQEGPAATVVVQPPQTTQQPQPETQPSWQKNAADSWQQQMEARRQLRQVATTAGKY